MTNEELQAKYESLSSMEDAYALVKENGYTGTLEDFTALCAKAADEIGPMDMDDMDAVAGGFGMQDIKDGLSTAGEAISGAFSKGWDWVKKNPELTAGIVGGVAVAAIGITVGVKALRNQPSAVERAIQKFSSLDDDLQGYEIDKNAIV